MQTLQTKILEYAARLPEGIPMTAKELLHLGSRAAVDQVLARLAKRGQLLRAGRGIYVRPVETRFGTRPPSVERTVQLLAESKGETVAPHGSATANALGLTTQVPTRLVYLTSGRSRRLNVGNQSVEFRHAPRWQLMMAERPAG
jgi:predicted transcriptional regulator of viral defense system